VKTPTHRLVTPTHRLVTLAHTSLVAVPIDVTEEDTFARMTTLTTAAADFFASAGESLSGTHRSVQLKVTTSCHGTGLLGVLVGDKIEIVKGSEE
jgi:hypothetical protein